MDEPRRRYSKCLDVAILVLSIFGIILGTVLGILQAIITGMNPVDVDAIAAGIWVGILVIITGILGILAATKTDFGSRKTALIIWTLVLSIICFVLACYTAINAILFTLSSSIYYMVEFSFLKFSLLGFSAATALINFILIILSLIAICSTTCCCPTTPPPSNEQGLLVVGGQAAQAQEADPQPEEALDHLPVFDFNRNWQPQVGNIAEAQGMQVTDHELADFPHAPSSLSFKNPKKEGADQLVLLNHFQEKNDAIKIELAKLQGKCDVLIENFEKCLEIKASSNVTIAECKFRLDELMKLNLELKSEVVHWKDNYSSILQKQQNPQLIEIYNSSLPVENTNIEDGDKLALLNHYKEKNIKLQMELAKLKLRYDVLREKFNESPEIEDSSKVTIVECKFRKDELMMENAQLKSEVAQWKGNCLRTQQAIIPQMQPIPRPNNPYYY